MPNRLTALVTIDHPNGRTDELIRDLTGYRWRSTYPATTTQDLIDRLQAQRAALATRESVARPRPIAVGKVIPLRR